MLGAPRSLAHHGQAGTYDARAGVSRHRGGRGTHAAASAAAGMLPMSVLPDSCNRLVRCKLQTLLSAGQCFNCVLRAWQHVPAKTPWHGCAWARGCSRLTQRPIMPKVHACMHASTCACMTQHQPVQEIPSDVPPPSSRCCVGYCWGPVPGTGRADVDVYRAAGWNMCVLPWAE